MISSVCLPACFAIRKFRVDKDKLSAFDELLNFFAGNPADIFVVLADK